MLNVAVPSQRELVEVLGKPQGVGSILGVGVPDAGDFGDMVDEDASTNVRSLVEDSVCQEADASACVKAKLDAVL